MTRFDDVLCCDIIRVDYEGYYLPSLMALMCIGRRGWG